MGLVIVSTYPDKKSISKIADIVVNKGLAACVNYTKIHSVYAWKGKLENTEEFLALFKTTTRTKDLLKKEIAKTHPYQVPEIVELKMDSVNLSYQNWLINSTRKSKPKKRNNSTK
ncbi:MAG: divalent-cation tolerance protein CutA [Thaumarchaeota archaeon]|nr:divalent-cation tolerance protein CutA [Nitrososphaerota archaeon]MDE1867792.1 divalent-cation tolerance protein CutA [Nitrososphaerota archaeon]